jgi:release factor glutamine methyltransferase
MLQDNTVRSLLESARQRLANAGCDKPGLDAEVLLAHTLHKDRSWLYAHPLEIPSQHHLDEFYRLLTRRERREPVAYLTGHKAFFALEFQVNQYVLIPRPETELLVETAIQMASRSFSSIADVGTGSGCIAIALAKNVAEASFFAVDVSPQALQLAQKNAARHGVADRISFLEGDLLQPLPGPVDLIVSNPPYVSDEELRAAAPEINQYEPPLALAGGHDGLEIIRQLLPQAKDKLKPGGSLLVEIGASQGPAATDLVNSHFPAASVQIKKDLAGLDRLLVVERGKTR